MTGKENVFDKKFASGAGVSEEKAPGNEEVLSRLNTVGGQAVIEGVMMKSRERYSVAVRREDGTIAIKNGDFVSIRKKYKILNLPILRGVINFVEMMKLSYKTLSVSAESLGFDEIEPETKFEKWLIDKFGKNIVNIIMTIAGVLGTVLGLLLFIYLPIVITKAVNSAAGGELGWYRNLIEGVIKISIFIGYLSLVSLMPDIRRTFEYHGAEHKSVFCYESGKPLTPENAAKCSRFHPRCGTSLLFVMLLISILIFSLPFVTWDNSLLRLATKLAMLPVIIGIGYEFIMYAGKHNNLPVRILSAPGLWVQRITTREPDAKQLEVAITALKSSMPSKFPAPTADAPTADETDSINGNGGAAVDGITADGPEKAETAADKTGTGGSASST